MILLRLLDRQFVDCSTELICFVHFDVVFGFYNKYLSGQHLIKKCGQNWLTIVVEIGQ